jgi:hypothetical protein
MPTRDADSRFGPLPNVRRSPAGAKLLKYREMKSGRELNREVRVNLAKRMGTRRSGDNSG